MSDMNSNDVPNISISIQSSLIQILPLSVKILAAQANTAINSNGKLIRKDNPPCCLLCLACHLPS